MLNPSKSISTHFQEQYSNIVSFKEQTLMLLKQQSEKIKQSKALISSKDQQLQIKDEQIKFLKETVKELQQENSLILHQKNQLNTKLDKIVQEVQSYNENVVKPICEDKEKLKKSNHSLKAANKELQKSLNDHQNLIQQSETKSKRLSNQLQLSNNQLKQLQIKLFQLEQKLQKQTTKSQKQTDEILKISNLLKSESLNKEKVQSQVSVLNKQLNSVIMKHNSSIKEYEKKLKQFEKSKVDASQIETYQQAIQSKQLQITSIKSQIIALKISFEQFKHKHFSEKEKLVKQISSLKFKLNEFVQDLINLKKSLEIGKKVIEFQSQMSEYFYWVYEKFQTLFEQHGQFIQKHQQILNDNQNLSRKVQKLSESLKDCQLSETVMKTQLHESLERLESSYEGKLVSMSLKIRVEQQALQRLKKCELEAMQQKQKLCHQLQALQEDFSLYRQTTEKSLLKLNEQNYRIVNEMKDLYKICQQNVDNKLVVNKIKGVVHSLIITLHYFQLKIFRSKQKQKKIYYPVVESYLNLGNRLQLVSEASQHNFKNQTLPKDVRVSNEALKEKYWESRSRSILQKKKSKVIRKLKASVWMIVACLRIQKQYQNNGRLYNSRNFSAIQVKLLIALKNRNKIHNMSEIMLKQGQIIEKNDEPQTIVCGLLKATEKLFSWAEPNYKKFIPEISHLAALDSLQAGFLKFKQNVLYSDKNLSQIS